VTRKTEIICPIPALKSPSPSADDANDRIDATTSRKSTRASRLASSGTKNGIRGVKMAAASSIITMGRKYRVKQVIFNFLNLTSCFCLWLNQFSPFNPAFPLISVAHFVKLCNKE